MAGKRIEDFIITQHTPEELREAMDEAWNNREALFDLQSRKALADPLVERFNRTTNLLERPPISHPWQAYAQRKLAATSIIGYAARKTRTPIEFMNLMSAAESLLLSDAECGTYLWTKQVESLCRSAPIPRCRVSSLQLQFSHMFFANEELEREGNVVHDWFAIFDAPESIVILIQMRNLDKSGELVLYPLRMPKAMQFPDDIDSGPDVDLIPLIGAYINRIAFVKESIHIDSRKSRLAKSERRELAKVPAKIAPTIDPEVHVCVLRHQIAEYKRRLEEAGHVEWKHQWWVCAHERNQWCPREKVHRRILIAPHPKGPPDKPFINRVYSVAR